ncbi:MAG: hypothetical protein ACKVWR_17180, partial [Acidimicrobiales bacterium]
KQGPAAVLAGEPPASAPARPARTLLLDPGEPSGLVHAFLSGRAALAVRAFGPGDGWFLTLDRTRATLEHRQEGQVVLRREGETPRLPDPAGSSVQVLDDGEELRVSVNGEAVFDGPVPAGEPAASGVGLLLGPDLAWGAAQRLEAHPRAVACPPELALSGRPTPSGREVLRRDEFDGEGVLAGRAVGDAAWECSMGAVEYRVEGGAAVVQARPRPGRLRRLLAVLAPLGERSAYTVSWEKAELADLTARILPPGEGRGEGAASRAGLVFWQDRRNYVIVAAWLDDSYGGAAISQFMCLDGYEELYDVVWTNVGDRITWGRAFELRCSFDGDLVTTWLDGEPVLQRALTDVYPKADRLRIARVGVAGNWEFGWDTGSRFLSFEARG